MKTISNQTFPNERDLYGAEDVELLDCRFEGEEDGESALKEAREVSLQRCYMDLRYPFWHVKGLRIKDSELTPNCRAAIWYSEGIEIDHTHMFGIKALRECHGIKMARVEALSPEFGWKSSDIDIADCRIESEYAFLLSHKLKAKRLRFAGKYAFQYTEDVEIADSEFHTKDCFWHSHNVVVRDSYIDGEYLAWYSDGLTLINCRIKGTQPFCYCTNLKLIDCVFEHSDLAFEYSDVEAEVSGELISIKNPRSGFIRLDKPTELILTDDSKYPCECRVEVNGKQNIRF